MSKTDSYRPFAVIRNAINKLESQGLLELTGDKDQIVELITQDLGKAGILREYINTSCPYPTNIHHTLEEFITEMGRVIFIHRMKFDVNQGLFTLDLKFDPESEYIDKTLTFRDVQDFSETLDDDEEITTDYVDSIIGLDQYSARYVLKTDVREIIFSSLATPEISLVKNSMRTR
jgi:hypothetical protein